MAATAQTQGFLGGVKIGNAIYTVRGNPQFRMSRNVDVTSMIGTGYPYLFSDGVRIPTITMSMVARDLVSPNPLGATFLGYFFGRSETPIQAPVWETPLIGGDKPASPYGTCAAALAGNPGIVFSDGETITCMWGVKAEAFRIGTAKGQDLTIDVTFVGTYAEQYRNATGTASVAQLYGLQMPSGTADCSAPLRFQSVTITPSLDFADKVFGFNLSWANNHTPNMGLDGTLFPLAQNAGMPNAGLSLTLQALDTYPDDSYTANTMTVNVTGATGSASFQLGKLVIYNPFDRSAPLGRVLRNYSYTILGNCTSPNTPAYGMVVTGNTSWT
jgi:hypothetical protein